MKYLFVCRGPGYGPIRSGYRSRANRGMADMKRNTLVAGVAVLALSLTPVAAHATDPSGPVGKPANGRAESGNGSPAALARRAKVTDIREIQNNRNVQVEITEGDSGKPFTIPSVRRWNGTVWVPWVGRDDEMSKSIHIAGGNIECWVFQDYWNPHDLIRYSKTKSYTYSSPVGGANTGGGRKVLTIGDNCSLSLEPVA